MKNNDGSIVIAESDLWISGQTFRRNLSAYQTHPDGRPYHTFRTATVLVTGNNITFQDCLFENTAGSGKKAGQAIALYLDGDGIRLRDCVIRGHQDTLFLAPLPLKEREKDGFIGPGEYKPRTPRTFEFENCRIEGSVDFVFGGATAYFRNCEFRSLEPGYVFAPSTPQEVSVGFVAENCRFTAAGVQAVRAETDIGHKRNNVCDDTNVVDLNAQTAQNTNQSVPVPDGSCYLGRPWREYGAVTLKNCCIGSHIAPEGWKDWACAGENGTARFTEIGSYGPGAMPESRAAWVSVRQ